MTDRPSQGDAWPPVQAALRLEFTDFVKSTANLIACHDSEPESLVVRRVPRHIRIGGQSQRAQPKSGRPYLGGVQQHPTNALSRVIGVNGHLLDVGAAVHHLDQEVGDRFIPLASRHPSAPIFLEDGQVGHRQWLVIGNSLHAEISKKITSSPLHVLESRQIFASGGSNHCPIVYRHSSVRGRHRGRRPSCLSEEWQPAPKEDPTSEQSSLATGSCDGIPQGYALRGTATQSSGFNSRGRDARRRSF